MNVWSEYLKAQAELADRMAATMVSAELRREFAEIAGRFRRDAELEDETPTHPAPERSYPRASRLS
jgi:hypothetical protein